MNNPFNDYPEAQLTPWFTKRQKPHRVGVYRTSREDITHLGSAYSYWNGLKWESFENWGQYHSAYLFVWRGLISQRRKPMAGSSLDDIYGGSK